MAIETIRDERVTFTVGSITVFIALMNAPNAEKDALATLTKIYSGGAPIPPSTVTAFEAAFGQYIHNIYGLTETTSPSHAVPLHGRGTGGRGVRRAVGRGAGLQHRRPHRG